MATDCSVMPDRISILVFLQVVFFVLLFFNESVNKTGEVFISNESFDENSNMLQVINDHLTEIKKDEALLQEQFQILQTVAKRLDSDLSKTPVEPMKEIPVENSFSERPPEEPRPSLGHPYRFWKGQEDVLEYKGKCLFQPGMKQEISMKPCNKDNRKQRYAMYGKTLRSIEFSKNYCVTYITEENSWKLLSCNSTIYSTQGIDWNPASKQLTLQFDKGQCLSTDGEKVLKRPCESAVSWETTMFRLPKVTILSPLSIDRCKFADNVYNNFARQVYEYDLKELAVLDSGDCARLQEIAKRDARVKYMKLPTKEECHQNQTAGPFLDLVDAFKEHKFHFEITSEQCFKRRTGFTRDLTGYLGSGDIFINMDSDDLYHHLYVNTAVMLLKERPGVYMLHMTGQTTVTIYPDKSYRFEVRRGGGTASGCSQVFRRVGFCPARVRHTTDGKRCCDYKTINVNEDSEFERCIKYHYKDHAVLAVHDPPMRLKIGWGGNIFRMNYNVENISRELTTEYIDEVVNFLSVASVLQGDMEQEDEKGIRGPELNFLTNLLWADLLDEESLRRQKGIDYQSTPEQWQYIMRQRREKKLKEKAEEESSN